MRQQRWGPRCWTHPRPPGQGPVCTALMTFSTRRGQAMGQIPWRWRIPGAQVRAALSLVPEKAPWQLCSKYISIVEEPQEAMELEGCASLLA